MNTRPALAALFVACCLLLCGLILRRQIAAHPLPPEAARPAGPGFSDEERWQAATPADRRQAQRVVTAYLAALRGGDAPAAAGCRSAWLRERFRTPAEFLAAARGRFPELSAWRRAAPGPVETDSDGQRCRTAFLLQEADGAKVRALFLLVREDGRLKIDRCRPERQR